MSFSVPYSLTLTLITAGVMQRLGAYRLQHGQHQREAKFSLYSSYICFAAALAALAAGTFLR